MLKCGARGSKLSVAQATGALELLTSRVKGFRAKLLTFTTPGDRDLTTPIEKSAPDFFTRDLDEAVRTGSIDFAIHSAKDLPERIAVDLDWFWLPNREDPRDCWVERAGAKMRRIGVSSERRAEYARKMFPRAKLLPMRGAVDARLAQVAEGRFDAALMAMAGLKRLFHKALRHVSLRLRRRNANTLIHRHLRHTAHRHSLLCLHRLHRHGLLHHRHHGHLRHHHRRHLGCGSRLIGNPYHILSDTTNLATYITHIVCNSFLESR